MQNAEIYSVGTWRQIFNKFRLFNVSEIFTIYRYETSIIQIRQRKVKKNSYTKIEKKITLL